MFSDSAIAMIERVSDAPSALVVTSLRNDLSILTTSIGKSFR